MLQVVLQAFVFFLGFVPVAVGVYTFPVHRMLQYEVNGHAFGAQRAYLNSFGVTLNTLPNGNLVRHIVLLNIEDIDLSLVELLINQRNADGLVILAPLEEGLDHLHLSRWLEIENELVKMKLSGAIYFAPRNPITVEFYEELSKQSLMGVSLSFDPDSYRLEVSPPEGAPINEVKVHNIQGWLAGTTKTSNENLPTIAIVASYDTFGIAPSLATGMDSNGSGIIALLELARLFSRLYSGIKTRPEYNILFLLTGGGRMNYVDTRLWLDKSDTHLLETIDFAICLDTIGTENSLYLHASRSEKDPKAKQIYDAFSSVAKELGTTFAVVHKKINISSNEVPWQHEQFSRKKILSATISSLPKSLPGFSRSNIFDKSLNFQNFERNIKLVAEGLSRYIYNLKKPNISIFEEDLAISSDYISSWASALLSHPRMMPFLSQTTKAKDAKEGIIIAGLEKELSKYVADVSRTSTILTKEDKEGLIFYDRTNNQLSAFRGKPVSFDILLSFAILSYLGILYTALKGPADTWLQVKSIFASKKKRK